MESEDIEALVQIQRRYRGVYLSDHRLKSNQIKYGFLERIYNVSDALRVVLIFVNICKIKRFLAVA